MQSKDGNQTKSTSISSFLLHHREDEGRSKTTTLIKHTKHKRKKRSKLPLKRQSKCKPIDKPGSSLSRTSNAINEGTALSPILNRVSSFTLPSLTRFKRRTGLVRRTHSPITTVSTKNCRWRSIHHFF